VTDKVIDASALAAVVFAESKLPIVEPRIVGHRLLGPHLLKSELTNVCVKKIRAQPAQRDTIVGLFSAAWGMPIGYHDIDPLEVLVLAKRLRLSAYDASYLWLAKYLGLELITLDEKLEKAAALV
jgi:predicted nucleic acid-binding protein